MGSPTTPSTACFTNSDNLLFNERKRKWYRFVPLDGYLAVFSGDGGMDFQKWEYVTTINKAYAKAFWQSAVDEGFVKME